MQQSWLWLRDSFTPRSCMAVTDKELLSNDKKAYVTSIRSDLENNWPVKHKRFHIKKSVTKQTITCPNSAA